MLSKDKHINKCVHYFRTNVRFKQLATDCTIPLTKAFEEVQMKYSDVCISYEEFSSFCRGVCIAGRVYYNFEFYNAGRQEIKQCFQKKTYR